jgi:hypothetical protein
MTKDKLAELECNLSRLNGNIERYNKLDNKYKDTVLELTDLKDYVKSVDGYIGDLETKVNTLIEYPREQNKRLVMLSEKVNKMNCMFKPLPIEEFNRIEAEGNKVRPQIEMFKKNIEESRKRIDEKIGTVLNPENSMISISDKPVACKRLTNKGWDTICDEKGNLVKKQVIKTEPQKTKKIRVTQRKHIPQKHKTKSRSTRSKSHTVRKHTVRKHKTKSRSTRSKSHTVRKHKTKSRSTRSKSHTVRKHTVRKHTPKKTSSRSARSKSHTVRKHKSPEGKIPGNKKYNKPKVCKMVCSRK